MLGCCWHFFDSGSLAGGCCCFACDLCLLSLTFTVANTRGSDQNMQGIACYPLKTSKIDKLPTPHHRENAALPQKLLMVSKANNVINKIYLNTAHGNRNLCQKL